MECRRNGTCKWFNATKGFGFITDNGGGGDLFVHHTCINGDGFKTLLEGEAVEFDVQTDEQGRKKAVNVSGPNGSKVVGDNRGPGFRSGGYGDRSYNQGGPGGYGSRTGGGRNHFAPSRDYNAQGTYGGGPRDYQNGGGGYNNAPRYGGMGGAGENFSRGY